MKQKEAEEKKKRDGYVKIRALDPLDGNNRKWVWVKKDKATLDYEKKQSEQKSLGQRMADVERKHRELEFRKKEAEIAEMEKKLAAEEKKLKSSGSAD